MVDPTPYLAERVALAMECDNLRAELESLRSSLTALLAVPEPAGDAPLVEELRHASYLAEQHGDIENASAWGRIAYALEAALRGIKS